MSNKKYGLILSDKGKQKPIFQASRNVFGNDSDSDDESNRKPALLRPSDNTTRQAKITQEKALIEDPTVYQYDEIYEDLSTKKDMMKVKSKEEKKPQYIQNLMKAANKRKIENERRIERQVQKEREKEGDEFQDKEVFVTSAYKKKLEEMRLEEEKEKREEYLENIGDVTKQKDLGGFYRHLYEQKLGKDKTENENADSTISTLPEVKEKTESSQKATSNTHDTLKKRNYRKRKSSDRTRLSEGEIEDSDEEINRVNLDDIRMAKKHKQEENIDADSDFSIDDSSDEDEKKDRESKIEKNLQLKSQSKDRDNDLSDADIKLKKNKHEKCESKETKDESIKPKEKIDIWKKRTVGPVYEEALKRYYERKSARGC